MSSPREQPKDMDGVLRAVVAEGDRRLRRRARTSMGAGGIAIGVLLIAGLVGSASVGDGPSGPVSAPGAGGGTLASPFGRPGGPGVTSPASTAPVVGRRPPASVQLAAYRDPDDLLAAVRKEALAELDQNGGLSGSFGYGRDRFLSDAVPIASAPGDLGGATSSQKSAGVAQPRTGGDFSTTNNQEFDVDEPDTVKTDGRSLFVLADDLRIFDAGGTAPTKLATLDLVDPYQSMLIAGDRLVLLGSRYSQVDFGASIPAGGSAPFVPYPSGSPNTSVAVVDISDRTHPKIVSTQQVEGGYLDARTVNGVVRLITRTGPKLGLVYPADGSAPAVAAARAENERRVRESNLADWLPDDVKVADAYHTQEASGLDVVTVRSVDPAKATIGAGVSVMTNAETVYASASGLYVATTDYDQATRASGLGVIPADFRTAVHKFDISDPAKARYVGSGDVPGRVLNQYSLSEYGDAIRVASTTGTPAPPPGEGTVDPKVAPSQSQVTILRPSNGDLVEVGSVTGLGKGESIFAVRFIGDRGYVVTFRQLDPLFVLDLHDPAHPTLQGELEIPGYSAYLHPVGDGRLIGIGQDADDRGRRQGFQISLFDVSDPAHPTKLAGAAIPGASSNAEYDFHAFLYWPATGLVLVPVNRYDQRTGAAESFAVGYSVGGADRSTLTELGRIVQQPRTGDPGEYVQRSVVVGPTVFTIGMTTVQANDLLTLHAGASVPF